MLVVFACLLVLIAAAQQASAFVVETPADALVSNFQEFGFLQAFLKSIAMILVTELGDKTFFIAAVCVKILLSSPF